MLSMPPAVEQTELNLHEPQSLKSSPVGKSMANSRISKALVDPVKGTRETYLGQRLENFFSKGPDGKYFKLCQPYSLCCN